MVCTPMDDQDIGTLYVLASCDSSLCKLGFTRNGTPELRAASYERQHGIQWPRVYWSAVTDNVAEVEARIHRELAPYRFALSPPGATEIYHLIPQHAVRIAERFVVTSPGIAQPQRPQQQRQRIPWLRYAEVAAAFAIAYWPMLHRTLRRLRAALH
jgi:hypothetical protein